MKRSLKCILIFLLLLLILSSAQGEVAIRILPEGTRVSKESDGYLIGYVPINEKEDRVIPCAPIDDSILTDDPDLLLVMRACRGEERLLRNAEETDVVFLNPYIFLIEEEQEIKRYYCALGTAVYRFYELEGGLKVFDCKSSSFEQDIITFHREDDEWIPVNVEMAKESFLPGIPVQEIEGYTSGITEEMWLEMNRAGYDSRFPFEQIKRYLEVNQYGDVFIDR